ncbi:MAG: hypothetical protein ACRDRK_26310, partial [Pseudonocardia sp.]
MTVSVPQSTWQPLAHRLAERIAADGALRTPAWRDAVLAVPRHEFVPRYYIEDTAARPLRWTAHEPHDPDSV